MEMAEWNFNSTANNCIQFDYVRVQEEVYPHRYPYDWRTKKPVIFRATEQWFASVEGFKQKALDAINEVSLTN